MPKSNLFQLPSNPTVGQKLSAQLSTQQAGFAAFVCGQTALQDSVSQKLALHMDSQHAEFSAKVWGQSANVTPTFILSSDSAQQAKLAHYLNADGAQHAAFAAFVHGTDLPH